MDIRKKILANRLWAYFGMNPEAISSDTIEVLDRNAANIRRIAQSNGSFDVIVSRLIQDLFAHDDENCAEVLESVAKDLRDLVQKSIKRGE
ncbi:MAG: hypothetical protein ACRC62_18440 [Microcoleus sp.]